MSASLTPLCLMLPLLLLAAACSSQNPALDLPPGHYEKTQRSTNSAGTTTEQERSADVYVDEYGNKKAVVTTKTTKDPKGLFNKRTTEQTREVIAE